MLIGSFARIVLRNTASARPFAHHYAGESRNAFWDSSKRVHEEEPNGAAVGDAPPHDRKQQMAECLADPRLEKSDPTSWVAAKIAGRF